MLHDLTSPEKPSILRGRAERSRRSARWTGAVVSVALALLGVVAVAPAAQADGTPDISIEVGAPAQALQGSPFAVTLTASNPTATPAYNTSFRLFVPTGAVLASAAPAADGPAIAVPGGSVYLWTNVSDLLAGTSSSITATIDPGELPLGPLSFEGGAYVNTNPRTLPRFDAAGSPIASSSTGFAVDTRPTELVPFTITKDVDAVGDELMRGVHDHRAAVTLRIDNNLEGPSSGYQIVDYIPATLEFLGCGSEDNALTVLEEYPLSGALNEAPFGAVAGSDGCPTPTTVETLPIDPPGSQPAGIYTVVTWDTAALATVGAGALAAGGTRTIHYVVGIPQNANTLDFQGATPSASSGEQGSNLDNNTGPSTLETGTEQTATNVAVLSGSYDDPHAAGGAVTYTAVGSDTVTLEDLEIQKSASTSTINQGAETLWTLVIRVSEYTGTATDLVVTDTLPDGLCPLGVAAPDAECAGGPAPSLPYTSAVENADGSWTLVWNAPDQATNGTFTITFTSRTREYYQENGADDTANPVRANDSWTNTVTLTGTVTEVINGVVQPSRPVADDAAAGQQARDITLTKEVAAPAADGTCSDGTGLTWLDDVAAAPFGPGDVVCWRIRIVAPANLDTTKVQLTDFLPAGYEYLSSVDGAGSAIAFPVPTVDGEAIIWDLTGVGDLDQSSTASVVVRSRITDPAAHEPGDIVANLAKLAYANTPGAIFQLREQADAPWKQPVLALDKTASPTVVDGSSTVTYTVTVANTGNQSAQDVEVRDLLPTQISCVDLVPGSLTVGFACTDDSPRDRIDGAIPDIAAGASGVVTYQVDVPNSVIPGTTLTNIAGVRTFDAATNDPAEPTFEYRPDNGNPLLNAGTPNAPVAQDTQNVIVRSTAVVKTQTTSVDEPGNALANQATPGEDIDYTLTVTLPRETTLTGAVLTDNVPATLLLDASSASMVAPGAGFTLSTTGSVVRVTFPSPYTVGVADETLAVTFTAKVRDAAGPVAPNNVVNSASLTATGMATANGSVTTQVVEPNLRTAKTTADADGRADPDEVIGFTVTATNSTIAPVGVSRVSTAHDVVVVDTLPTSMNPLDAGGNALTADGVVAGGALWNNTARTITWNSTTTPALSAVAPGTTVTLPYQVRVVTPVPSPTSFTNTVVTTARSLPEATDGERTAGSLSPSRYSASDAVVLAGPRPSLTKSVTPGTATIGEEVSFTIVATIPASVTTFDATVIDTLPAGLTYVATDSASCTAPVGCSIGAVTPLTPSAQQLAWFLGDLQDAVSVDRQVTIVYRAQVADVPAAAAGASLVNSARVATNLTDQLGSPASVTDLGTFTETSGAATATVLVVEPDVSLTKTVALGATQVRERNVRPGDVLTYSITVTNANTATTSTAHGVVVRDTTDPRFGTIANVTGATVVDGDATGDGGLVFSVADLAPGTSVTITYDVVVPAKADLPEEIGGPELVNIAQAGYSSLDGAVPGERTYTSNTDRVELEADVASLGDRVWFDLNGDGIQQAEELGVVGATVTVVWAGPNGVLGDADDVTYPSSTTGADGAYLADLLPEGLFSVTVSGLPAGTALTHDEDSGTTAPDGTTLVTLSDGEFHPTADFGIRGTGTVGSLVWLDLDGDGVQDSTTTEPGLAGVVVTVTWPAVDGLPAGSVTTTTDATGAWSVTGIPAVDVTVTLDPATSPPGTVLVSEPHGGLVDGTATFPLAPGATDSGFNFGLRGTAQLGDRVWVDTNRDGNQDPGEPGIPGAVLEIRWPGVSPLASDDLVLTVMTGADGLYTVPNLPYGDITVTVLSLPTALMPTYDEDSGTTAPDRATVVTLSAGNPVHETADFGFVAETGVGDRVWLDQNGDGVQDLGEPGIPGVEITVTSAGADGVLGTADDIVRTTTTGVDGAWSVTGLPAGPTWVEVTGGLPAGVEATYDSDGLGTPGRSEVVLVADSYDDVQDFGYRGVNSIGDRTWVDVDGDGAQDAGEPGLGGLTVQITYLGADGVAGGGDDLLLTTVTATDGSYLVPGLPDGDYTVVVTGGVPAGYTPTWDETGASDGTSVVVGLGVGTSDPVDHLTADFGYGGTGALGGTVWLEREVDGLLDAPTEAGIPGIGIDVTWAGPDGVLGTPDDVVIRVVTGPGGVWLVEGIPPGPFVATVDLTTLPPGTSVVWDRENGPVSPTGSLSGTLTPGERRLDVDTGVQGTSSIGDLVWVDQNRNGTRDATDPIAPNVRVVVTWHGADGVLGGGDDVTIEERTGADGIYLADFLPAGRYTVTFDRTTFPRATTAYADVDGGDPLVSTVDLAEGQDRTDVDLVLRPAALALTGASVGLLLLVAGLLIGTGLLLQRRRRELATD